MSRRLVSALALLAALSGAGARDVRGAPPPAPQPSPGPQPGDAAGTEAAAGPEPSPAPELDCVARRLDDAERNTLLRLAWRTLSGHLTGSPIKDADLEAFTFTACLMAPRGLFVTLRKGEQIRGRQGEIESTRPLYQQVIVFTRRAATRDPRFLPLTDRDLDDLTVELSIIGERRKIGGPGKIHLDTDGVFLEKWGRRALFLPGIAATNGWTAERTLDELCAQAALPKGSWAASARLEVFTTEVVAGGPPPSAAPSPTADPSAPPAAAAPEPPRGASGAFRRTAARSTT